MAARILSICACLAGLFASHSALAEGGHVSDQAARARVVETHEAEPAQYRALINQALEEYEAQNFAEARALMLRAHHLLPSARTLRALGMTEFELRNYVDSVARLEEALASHENQLSGELRAQTVQLLARARSYVGEIVVETTPRVGQGLRITVDSEPTGRGAGQRVHLNVGEHVLVVQAPGYLDEKRSLSIKGAEQRRILLELRPEIAEARGPLAEPSSPPSSERDRPLRKNPWLWSGVAALVVGGAVAGVLVALRKNDTKEAPPIPGDIGDIVQTLRSR